MRSTRGRDHNDLRTVAYSRQSRKKDRTFNRSHRKKKISDIDRLINLIVATASPQPNAKPTSQMIDLLNRLKAAGKKVSVKQAISVFQSTDANVDYRTFNNLLKKLTAPNQAKKFQYQRLLFDKAPFKDSYTCNIHLKQCLEAGDLSRAWDIFQGIWGESGLADAVTYNTII